jgi:hypothetical protein
MEVPQQSLKYLRRQILSGFDVPQMTVNVAVEWDVIFIEYGGKSDFIEGAHPLEQGFTIIHYSTPGG